MTERAILRDYSVRGWKSNLADSKKLLNLIRRRNIYSDVMQTVSRDEFFVELLKRFDNSVPDLHDYLLGREVRKGVWTMVPPAIYQRDGKLIQPPIIELDFSESIV